MSRILPALLAVALGIYCLIECVQTDRGLIRYLPKALWLLLILVVPVLGPLAWLYAGRPRASGPSAPQAPVARRPPPTSPRAPDDDPDFLARLDEERRRAAREQQLRPHTEPSRTDEDPEPQGDSGS